MTRWSIRFSDGTYGPLVSEDAAVKAFDAIDPERRPLCALTTWTEGTREEIVAEWLRERIRSLVDHGLGMSEERHWTGTLLCGLLGERADDPATSPTLRPSAPSQASAAATGPWISVSPPHKRPTGLPVLARRFLGDYSVIEQGDRWHPDITQYAEILPPPRSELLTLDESEAR